MKQTPPRFATRLLRWFCNVEFIEEIEGDLHEQFRERTAEHGVLKAKLLYVKDVLQAIRSYPQRRTSLPRANRISMVDIFNHFFKIASRNIARSKSSALINITGLAISIASFLLIGLYVMDEMTYETFHPSAESVYRIGYSYKRYGDGVEETDARTAGLWSVAMKESMPEIKHVTRISRFGYPGTVRYERLNKTFIEQQFFWVDTTFTDIFRVEMTAGGDALTILKNPHQVIITSDIAKKYFGKNDPIGEAIIYVRDGIELSFTVGGIMREYPTNTHFHPDFLASNVALNPLWKRNNEDRVNSWRDPFTYSYLQVTPGTDEEKLYNGLRRVFDEHLGEDAKQIWPSVVALTDIHFTKGKVIELETAGDKSNVYIFSSVGLLILLIASINYMNLATARSIKRSREVGLRKTLGGTRTSLIIQFLGESILTTAIAVILAVAILALLLPHFNELTAKRFTFSFLFQHDVFTPLLAVTLMVGLISGTYPAFYLSSFNPTQVLKGKYEATGKAENLRKTLVVFQFVITLFLIVSTLVIHQQLKFINNTKLSEYQDQTVLIRLSGCIDENNVEQVVRAIQQQSTISDVSVGTHFPRAEHYGWIDTRVKAPALGVTEYIWQQLDVSANFPAMFDLQLISGRTFSEMNQADSMNVLVNETALKDLQINASQAIGITLENPYTGKQKTIIGVVRDFNYASVRRKIEPLMINCKTTEAETMYVKMVGTNYPGILASIEAAWKKISPSSPFEYSFLNEQFTALYKSERQISTIFIYFAVLAIIIGCLGLFGLASFTAEQKTKEIGIRKVLGASALQIVLLINFRFVKLIFISIGIGIPLSYFLISQWLNDFAYKVELHAIFFFISVIFVLAITFMTVCFETLRAALVNPVNSIRHE